MKKFKCPACKKITLTEDFDVKCEGCGNEFVLKDGQYYRKSVYSKMYRNFRKE